MTEMFQNSLEQNLEKILVSELCSRYGIAKNAVYNKLKKLYIKPFTGEDGNKYITLEELELLDELDTFLKEKRGDAKDFVQLCVEQEKIIIPEGTVINLVPKQSIAEEISEQSEQTEAIVVTEQANQRSTLTTPEQQQLAVVEEEQVEISSEASQQSVIEHLQTQKGLQTQAEDIQDVHERSRNRAFVKTIAEESLVLMYEATENFTPEQKQQLEQHRAHCQQARTSRKSAHNVNDFLSQALSGFTVSPNFKPNPSPSPSGASTNV
jgi:hypothetical protein